VGVELLQQAGEVRPQPVQRRRDPWRTEGHVLGDGLDVIEQQLLEALVFGGVQVVPGQHLAQVGVEVPYGVGELRELYEKGADAFQRVLRLSAARPDHRLDEIPQPAFDERQQFAADLTRRVRTRENLVGVPLDALAQLRELVAGPRPLVLGDAGRLDRMRTRKEVAPLDQLIQPCGERFGVQRRPWPVGGGEPLPYVRYGQVGQQGPAEDPHDRHVLQPLGRAQIGVRRQPLPRPVRFGSYRRGLL